MFGARITGFSRFGRDGLYDPSATDTPFLHGADNFPWVKWFSDATPQTGLHIGISSGGWGDINYVPTPLFFAFNTEPWSTRFITMQVGLIVGPGKVARPEAIGISFIQTGNGEGRLIKLGATWPEGTWEFIISAGDGTDTVHRFHRLTIGDHGYPADSAVMVDAPLTPHVSATEKWVHTSASGSDDGNSVGAPWSILQLKAACNDGSLQAGAAGHPVYIHLSKGDYFSSSTTVDNFYFLLQNPVGTPATPFVFDAVGSGAKPKLKLVNFSTGHSFCIFRDIEIEGARFYATNLNDTGYVIDRSRLERCTFDSDQIKFWNYDATFTTGIAQWPKPDALWAGGNNGVMRNIELIDCTGNQPTAGAVDIINVIGLDYGFTDTNGVYRNSGEETIDVSGGENIKFIGTRCYGSQRKNVLKAGHAQSREQKLVTLDGVVALRSDWDNDGADGNVLLLQGCAGCVVKDSIFSSRFSMVTGERDTGGSPGYGPYSAMMGNVYEDNLFHGAVQIQGQRTENVNKTFIRNQFKHNLWHSWTGLNLNYDAGAGEVTSSTSNILMRFWGGGTPLSQSVDRSDTDVTHASDFDLEEWAGTQEILSDAGDARDITDIVTGATFVDPDTVGAWTWI